MSAALQEKLNLVNGCIEEMFAAFNPSWDPALWLKLVNEETQECLDAIRNNDRENALKEAADLVYVTAGFQKVFGDGDNYSHEFATEVKYVLNDAFLSGDALMKHFGFTGEQTTEAFIRVHASNMTKLDMNGIPIRREDGKILKGPNYIEPDLSDLI